MLVTSFFADTALSSDESVVVIIHPSVTTNSLSRNLLRSIFSMRLRTWENGLPVSVFVLPDDAPLHSIFAKQKLNIFPYQLRSTWDRLVYSGTGQAPFIVHTELEMRTRIASTPGAIGYLSESMINDSIQVVHTDE
ncbi:hypothetical protein FBR06_01425 [Betaproteobacteria bacterium PRO4]|nr:hypothetical protein [Burkholderiales bacterium]MDL1865915.1 hypothetical protein [Betaproteobacteria bacterium PRO4]